MHLKQGVFFNISLGIRQFEMTNALSLVFDLFKSDVKVICRIFERCSGCQKIKSYFRTLLEKEFNSLNKDGLQLQGD